MVLGGVGPALRQVWFVLHGYSQLARTFVREFEELDDGTRMIVAPEALNRFYLDTAAGGRASDARVGATWMTREDRLAEIADYVAYLDAVYAQVFESVTRDSVTATVLGFSQGVATAVRWLSRGKARAERLILWAGALPPDLDREAAQRLRQTRVLLVTGSRDRIAGVEAREVEDEQLATIGLSVERAAFEGGHRLDAALLRELAA